MINAMSEPQYTQRHTDIITSTLAYGRRSLTVKLEPIYCHQYHRFIAFELLSQIRCHHHIESSARFWRALSDSAHKKLTKQLTTIAHHILVRHHQTTTPRLFINIRADHLSDEAYIKALQIIASPFPVCLEVTEDSLPPNHHAFSQLVSTTSSMGISVALDDFGAAKANLDQVLNVPFDIVKIDKDIFRSLLSKPNLLQDLVYLIKNHTVNVVIEGCETYSDFVLTQSLNVMTQGYFFNDFNEGEWSLNKQT